MEMTGRVYLVVIEEGRPTPIAVVLGLHLRACLPSGSRECFLPFLVLHSLPIGMALVPERNGFACERKVGLRRAAGQLESHRRFLCDAQNRTWFAALEPRSVPLFAPDRVSPPRSERLC